MIIKPIDINNKHDLLIQEAGRVSWAFYKHSVEINNEAEAESAANDLFETIINNGGIHGQYA